MPLVTFLLGFLALLGWLYVTTADRTTMYLLRRSLLYFVVAPLLLIVVAAALAIAGYAMSPSWLGNLLLNRPYLAGLLVAVICEEALKLWASRSECSGIRVFALMSLFGIYELMLMKPLMFALAGPVETNVLLPFSALPGVFLHVLTAAIYAFHWRSRPVVQFGACTAIHLGFNIFADQTTVGHALWLASIFPLIGITLLLLPNKESEERGHWVLPKQHRAVSVR